jgi:hypothetical protein
MEDERRHLAQPRRHVSRLPAGPQQHHQRRLQPRRDGRELAGDDQGIRTLRKIEHQHFAAHLLGGQAR